MLKSDYYIEPAEVDRLVFEQLVPADHYLRRVKTLIDFESFRDKVKDCYSPAMGRTAEDPVRLIKLQFLQFHYNLSDREVLAQAQVNVAFRYFLDLALQSPLPVPSLLSQFRTRLGVRRYQDLFQDLLAQARAQGLVKDRLRLKDATHVIANVAVPTTLTLVAQMRQRVLRAAQPYAPEQVAAEEAEALRIRQVTADLRDQERLGHRVQHLRTIVAWADQLQQRLGPAPTPPEAARQRLDMALRLVHKLLGDLAPSQATGDARAGEEGLIDSGDSGAPGNPSAPDGQPGEQLSAPRGAGKQDRLRSVVDPDMRTGKHGDYYDGYLLDIALDSDSELITALNVLPANGDEGADAQVLLQTEEQTHGNEVQALSMDGAGFKGKLLRTLQAPTGLGLTVYVPPHAWSTSLKTKDLSQYLLPEAFQFVPNATGSAAEALLCPGEEVSTLRKRNRHDTGWVYRFKAKQCRDCPLLAQCLKAAPTTQGRRVMKNDYEAEYAAARARAQTPEYARVRQEHPRVERKLAELMVRHAGRRTRYRRQGRVQIQYLLLGLVVNVKRMVRLLSPHASREATPHPRPH